MDVHDSDDVIDLDGDEAPRLVAGPRARCVAGSEVVAAVVIPVCDWPF